MCKFPLLKPRQTSEGGMISSNRRITALHSPLPPGIMNGRSKDGLTHLQCLPLTMTPATVEVQDKIYISPVGEIIREILFLLLMKRITEGGNGVVKI